MTIIAENQAREQLAKAAHMLFQSGVMSHSGHGNMSFRLPESEHMLLTSGAQSPTSHRSNWQWSRLMGK